MRRPFKIAATLADIVLAWIVVGVVLWPRVDPLSAPPTAVIALSSNITKAGALDYPGTTRLTKALAIPGNRTRYLSRRACSGQPEQRQCPAANRY